MIRKLRPALTAAALGLASMAPALAADETLDERASYSYVRTLEGRATLASSTRAPGELVGVNEPLLQGDQVQVERGARVEIVLADRNLLRVAGGSTLRLVRVAFSADRDDRTTRIDLDLGEVVLDVTEQALGDELPEVRTPSGTVYVHQPGRYRLALDSGGSLLLTVREGYAELLTGRGSTVVRSGEEAWATGDEWGTVELTDAGPRGSLERWADDLERGIERASQRELRVEPHLAYSAASLDDYGSWVYVDTSWYWRPRASFGWRPYWDGRWAWTPSGLTWVSYEPWGWVPYHYGSWAVVPGHGWCWRPGAYYSPAWVYWYVGPTWTGWCPIGYYTHHYRNYWGSGFNFGVYGWTAGSWGFYADWCFLPSHRLFVRHGGDWRRTGSHLGRTEGGEVPPGILTTDTGDLPRERWERPVEVVRDLERRAGPRFSVSDGRVPEVTDFVARRPNLPLAVERAVVRETPRRGGERRASALDPGAAAGAASAERRLQVSDWRRRPDDGARTIVSRTPRRDEGPSRGDDRRLGGGPVRGESARGSAATAGRGIGGSATDAPQGAARRGGYEVERDTPAATDRQGWRRLSGGPTESGGGRAAAPPRRDEPVSRVIGGVRRAPVWDRGAPGGGPGAGSAQRGAAGGFDRPSPSSPATSPRLATPPVGWRGSPTVAPRGSAPTVAPRGSAPNVAPRGSAPTSPRAAPASPPPGRGAGAPTVSSSGRGNAGRSSATSGRGQQGSSGGRSQASARGGSKPSQSSSSPPPKRQGPPRGDG
ncbi:MAG TPA: DUF6600 domain-containing protein [Thermoanaerobaculia bacterium]